MLNNVSIGLFIDGGYFDKVYHEANNQGYTLYLSKLMKFCVQYLSTHYGINMEDCHMTEKHYYRGRYRVEEAIANNVLERERRFEDGLIEHDVVFHYKHLQNIVNEFGYEIEREKGIDVWFALDAYQLSIARNLDIVVLFTGDGDHEMLLHKIKMLKKKAVLLTWHLNAYTSVSKRLIDEASIHIDLKKLLIEHREYLPFFLKNN